MHLDDSQWRSLQWVASVMFVIIFWELTKAATRSLLFGRGSASPVEKDTNRGTPSEFLCLVTHPYDKISYGNEPEPHHYETEDVSTSWTVMFKTRGLAPGPTKAGDVDIGKYFKNKKRLWEIRMSITLKTAPPPNAEFVFGFECTDHTDLSWHKKKLTNVITNTCRQALGGELYHTFGDDPAKVSGEVESPASMMPLWAFDQFIVTPEGQKPPNVLSASWPTWGKTRSGRVREYIKEVEELKRNFRCGPTYSFAVWGPSRFFPLTDWTISMPVMTIPVNSVCGRPPLVATVYARVNNDPNEKRHLPSQLTYYWRAFFWSQAAGVEQRRLAELFGPSWATDDDDRAAADSLERGSKSCLSSSLSCCAGRTRN